MGGKSERKKKPMFCHLNQWKISRRVDAGDNLPPRLQEHIARCERCRRHFDEQRSVATLLSAHAADARREPPPFLHGKIMAALRHSEAETKPWFPRWAVVASVALALAAVWFTVNQRAAPDVVAPLNLASHSVTNTISPGGGTFPLLPSVSLAALNERLEQPFAQEASAVMADVRSSVQLLAQNFVPAEWQRGMRVGAER